jgi:hypothetical protein
MLIITQHFEHRLQSLSYPTNDLRWHLGYCQGDGMAFYGVLSERQAIGLADRLLAGPMKAAAKRAIRKGAGLEIRKSPAVPLYDHERTMLVEGDDWRCGPLTKLEEVAFNHLLGVVSKDVVDLSKQLANEGYQIIESTPRERTLVREFTTPRFKLEVYELPDEHFSVHRWRQDLAGVTLRELAAGKLRFFGVEVMVKAAGLELGSDRIFGCTAPANERVRRYGDHFTDMVRRAVEEARDTLHAVCLKHS